MPKKILISFIFVVFLLSPFSFNANFNFSYADTEVYYQSISSDTTWDLAGSPYLVYGDVAILPGATLTINPGVIIKLSGASLTVRGRLKVLGEDGRPVIFTSLNDDGRGGQSTGSSGQPAVGDWGVIKTLAGGSLNFNYAIINYGGWENIYLVDNRKIIEPNLAQAFYSKAGVIKSTGGQAAIDNSEIAYNEQGIFCNINSGQVSVHNSKIYNNLNGGLISESSAPVDAINNWWGDNSGPYQATLNPLGQGDSVSGNVLFDPWVGKNTVPALEPVIIVPGVMGSDLINASDPNDKIWLDTKRVIESFSDDFLDYLKMDNNGNTINAIKVGDAIREIKVTGVYSADVLNGLINYLQANGYEENKNLFVFPYDWRQDISWTAFLLNQKISDVLSQTLVPKVNIIAHSLGGLVVKDYMKKYADQNKIDKFIDIATPHFGSPAAFKALKYGDDFGFKLFGSSLLNNNKIKIISQNMPSIYELLPSAAYYDSSHDYNFIYSDQGHNYDYEDVNSSLRIWNNPILVNEAKEFHNNLDDYSSYKGDTKTYNIIGCGFATIGKIIKLNQEKDHHEYRIDYISGDSTVPLKSAEGISADKKYYYDGAEHMSLPSADGVAQLVDSILDGEESQFDLSPYPMSTQSNICQIRGKLVTYHSPIALHAYDENGNHAGPNASGEIENQIPGAQYDIIEDNKFVFLPSGHTYTIVGQATGLGAFNSRVETIDNGIVTQTAYYNQIPLATSKTNVEMTVTDNQTDYTMKVDQDGDHIFETIVLPSSMLNEQDSADLVKPETSVNILGTEGNENWYTSSVQISFTASDNEGGSGILKTEYSLDNGLTWQVYVSTINIDKQGANKILFKSTDRAGNIEEEKISEFKIDSVPPTIEMIAPLANDEYDHAENLEILYNSIDSVSGLNESVTKIQIDGQDISTTSIDLFSYHLGGHQLIIKTVDLAGNETATTVPFSVTTGIPGTIDDIKRLYFEKQITKVNVKDELIKELNSIQQYLERFGDRQDKKLSKYQERLEKCDRLGKRTADCRESVKKLYERQVYLLNKTYAKIVADRFVDLLKDLEKYYSKKWLTPKAYEMIKEELIYLKNNL